MKIAVFGATGRVGRHFLELALKQGHELQLLVRNKQDWMDHEKLTIHVGDARESSDVEKTLGGVEAVFSALGTDKTTTLTDFVAALVPSMEKQGIKRVVTIGTAGILQSRTQPELYRFQSGESNRKLTFAAEQHAAVYETFRDSSLDWTIVCPTYLPDGPLTQDYRIEEDKLPVDGKQISTADTAHCAYTVLTESHSLHKRLGVAY